MMVMDLWWQRGAARGEAASAMARSSGRRSFFSGGEKLLQPTTAASPTTICCCTSPTAVVSSSGLEAPYCDVVAVMFQEHLCEQQGGLSRSTWASSKGGAPWACWQGSGYLDAPAREWLPRRAGKGVATWARRQGRGYLGAPARESLGTGGEDGLGAMGMAWALRGRPGRGEEGLGAAGTAGARRGGPGHGLGTKLGDKDVRLMRGQAPGPTGSKFKSRA